MARITITVSVNTQTINNQNILQNVTLEDDNGGSGSQNPEEFTTPVAISNEVFWTGKPSDRSTGDTVALDQITHVSGTNILGQTELNGDPQGDVLGEAVDGSVDDEQKYGIYFTVTKVAETPVQYFLDPKLKIHD